MRPRAKSDFPSPSKLLLVAVAGAALALGCMTNPVTGKTEFGFVSEQQEIQIGEQYYSPTRQEQGGDYTVDPELSAYVSEVGQKLAKVSQRPSLPYEFVVINNTVPNAWALPGGKIAVNRGLLLALENEAQLAAVLGHEIVHAAARHGAKSMERGVLLQSAVAGTQIATGGSQWASLAVQSAGLGAQLTSLKYGRDAERESDKYGIEVMQRAGYDPRAAIRLQEIFVELSNNQEPDWLSGLLASHPASQERVENNRKDVEKLLTKGGAPGELYAERYQRTIARLRRSQDAYAAADRGREALVEGNVGEALRLANQAIAIEPREARFHELRGDARLAEDRYEEAVTNYNRAIERDESYFRPYLLRGVARDKLGDRADARADIESSYRLYPLPQIQQLLSGS